MVVLVPQVNPEPSITYNLEAKGFEDSTEFISLFMKKWFLIQVHISNTGVCQSKQWTDVPALTLSAQIPLAAMFQNTNPNLLCCFPIKPASLESAII